MDYLSLSTEISQSGDGFIPVPVKVYKRRWWILFLFSALGFMQCAVWNTWGPITASVKYAYPSWDNAEIGLFSMWGTLTMILGLFPFVYFLQKKDLRKSMILTSVLIAAGTSIRLISQEEKIFTLCANVGAILNGFGGIIIGAAPSMLSSRWFPPNERTTATAVGCTFNQLGNAGGFFFGPWIVQAPTNHSGNRTSNLIFDDIETEKIRRSIRDYMWITAGLCIPLFIFVLVYFPNKPKRPPSLTSAIPRMGRTFKQDLALIVRNSNFLMLLIPYSLTIGVNVAWSSVIDINVASSGITQDEASNIGVCMTIGGVILALIVCTMTDFLFGYIKVTIIILTTIATLAFIWFLFIMNHFLPFNKTQLTVSSILGASFSYACSPLFFELAVELAYPVPEGIVGGFLSFSYNVVAAIFLLLLQFKMESVIWMDYLLAIQGVVSLFVLIFVKEEYNRTMLDHTPHATVRVEDDDDDIFDYDYDDDHPLLGDLFRSQTSAISRTPTTVS